MNNVINIKLSGSLGRRFGVFHKYAVESWPECVRALSSQVEGFKDFMQSEVGSRMKFAIFLAFSTERQRPVVQFSAMLNLRR